jgi:hypothetical protein
VIPLFFAISIPEQFDVHDPEGTTQVYYDDYDQGRFAESHGGLHDLDSGEDDYA